ncbi:hypothetical protein ACPB9J_33400 [Streptomyces lavendulocolor]|uniref:hypothetical protein n=1 Tax=Streptomyces lavendulocolor TaxID=67316 RepID=UPI003C2E9198
MHIWILAAALVLTTAAAAICARRAAAARTALGRERAAARLTDGARQRDLDTLTAHAAAAARAHEALTAAEDIVDAAYARHTTHRRTEGGTP